jgi:repressor LexA
MTTDFQDNLYNFINEYITHKGISPSYAEMLLAMGISPHSKSLITRSLRALNKEGKIVLKKEGRRVLISVISKQLPLIGCISAGNPIEAISDYQSIDINKLLEGESRFALQVKGNSMIDDGILNGDIIICRHTSSANEGDIVVALIDQHNTTLKRISFKVKGMITLVPSNPDLKPRAYAAERVFIQGIYVGLVRIHT